MHILVLYGFAYQNLQFQFKRFSKQPIFSANQRIGVIFYVNNIIN